MSEPVVIVPEQSVQRSLEGTVSVFCSLLLTSPLTVDSYGSAMVACDEAEERGVEAGLLMELIRACQESADLARWCHVVDTEGKYGVWFGFSELPERLEKAVISAMGSGIPVYWHDQKCIGFRLNPTAP